jgi:hypothetical protein
MLLHNAEGDYNEKTRIGAPEKLKIKGENYTKP